ncbi:hypothetical protein EMIT0196MI5_30410 [Pseudomonas sp. IT-196MI5]
MSFVSISPSPSISLLALRILNVCPPSFETAVSVVESTRAVVTTEFSASQPSCFNANCIDTSTSFGFTDVGPSFCKKIPRLFKIDIIKSLYEISIFKFVSTEIVPTPLPCLPDFICVSWLPGQNVFNKKADAERHW